MVTNSGLRKIDFEERRAKIEKELGISLKSISYSLLDERSCNPNIENMIGGVQLPLGIAGPVKINGEFAQGSFYLPLATTEGALVASVSRGCKSINESGGAVACILEVSQARSILFKTDSIIKAKEFSIWAENNFQKLKKAGEEGEKFLCINSIKPYQVGLNVWLRIGADPNEAMGMNMVTIAGKNIAEYISKHFPDAEFISESGNMCVDKKPSAMNLINSRGKRAVASADIPEEIIGKVLKTTSEKLIDMNYRKNLLGSAASGSLGYNAHFANVIAAMFIATGQDAAHVVDGSLGFTTVERTKTGVNFSVTLPSLQVGTVGGGTGLLTQKECLQMLGCFGPEKNNSRKLAEIVASAVLAGEISLLAALCTNDLSKAHKMLNR